MNFPERSYKYTLAIREKAMGREHPEVAISLNNLAEFYDNQGQYAKAEPLYERALAIREKAMGREHPEVAISLDNLAGLYRAQGQYAKAEPLHERALAIGEKVLGPEHPDVPRSSTTWRCSIGSEANTRRPSPFTGGRWRFGKRPWARSTPTWRHPWKTTLLCYETWAGRKKQRVLSLEPMRFELRALD